MTPGTRGPVAATDLVAELERDPRHQQRAAEREAREKEVSEALRRAEAPLLADLAQLGITACSVWDLHTIPGSLPKAIPVLIEHLTRDYPDTVYMGIGQALNAPAARAWWAQLKALYKSTDNDTVRDRLAAALAMIATRAHYDDLLAFLADESLGATRIYFLRPVNRIGNRMRAGKGRSVIEELAGDAVLGAEASAVLAGRSRNG